MASGEFSTAAATGARTLVFSFMGFSTQRIAWDGSTTLQVKLAESSKALSEVVVTALGIKRDKKALGYTVAELKGAELSQGKEVNVANALSGKVAGVQVSRAASGAGGSSKLVIRGNNSLQGNSQPLYVIDGVPLDNQNIRPASSTGGIDYGDGISNINPEDIESISILKGAPAAALYGSEAVNGVVLITTKSGKGSKGGFNVDVNANYNFDEVAYLPRYQNVRGAGAPLHVSNGGQDAEGFVYQDLDGDGVKETRGLGSFTINFGPKFDGKPTVGWDGIVRPYEAQKDNYKGLFRTAQNSGVTVAISQATENSNMRLSLTRQDNQGVSLGSDNKRISPT